MATKIRANRCSWCGDDPLYVEYHDKVWGRPVGDGLELFEKLCLEGQQAGLSWITVLRKQETYREAYYQFHPEKIVRYVPRQKSKLLQNPGIIRNKLKVESIVKNAKCYLELRDEGIDFAEYLWGFVDGAPVQHQLTGINDIPTTTPESDAMSSVLKKRGFTFVGSTICYAFMQAVGMVNDHLVDCYCWEECNYLGRTFSL